MNLQIFVFISVFFVIYGLGNYYIGLRGWQALQFISPRMALVWTVSVGVLSCLFILGRIVDGRLPHWATKTIIYGGSYWMAAFFYFLLFLLGLDLLRLAIWVSPLPDIPWTQWRYPAFLALCLITGCLLLFGSWNALHPVIRQYDVTLPRKAGFINDLHVVAVSDIHLGWIVGLDRLSNLVARVNDLQPDMILFIGDILDEGVDPKAEDAIPQIFGSLHAPLGSYAVLGNHEYISRQTDRIDSYLQAGGVTLLRDQSIQIYNSFCLLGRDDRSRQQMNGGKRKDLSLLLTESNSKDLPLILMDHQPFDLEEAEKCQIDLQLSGHTHHGQMTPNQFITRAIYDVDWGYLQKGNLQILVSCGYGTWGPPIRIGNRPEIMDIYIHFDPSS